MKHRRTAAGIQYPAYGQAALLGGSSPTEVQLPFLSFISVQIESFVGLLLAVLDTFSRALNLLISTSCIAVAGLVRVVSVVVLVVVIVILSPISGCGPPRG